ncbi:MAG: cupredoxin domain-containing protein [Chloroflexi bacterium]|nr:cupredoxin domain-containing protein [Chloroflexota bacterium]
MIKQVAAGVVIGVGMALAVMLGVGVVQAQGPSPSGITAEQMKPLHEAMHGAGSWDSMVQQMEQAFGANWFDQMHNSGMMNGQGHMGAGAGGMMGGGYGGMMGGGYGGMMGRGSGSVPTAVPDDNRPVDQTIELVAQNLRYQPVRVTLKAGQTVRLVVTNRDAFAHNLVGKEAGIAERVIAGGTTQSLVWTAPTRTGTYRVQCTYHPGMTIDLVVE